MTITQRVSDFIRDNRLIERNDRIMAGISGGADSVCLLYVLMDLREDFSFELSCVHVEHGIRGAASRKDEEFVRKLCRDNNISLLVYHENVPEYADIHKLSLEEAARLLRYNAFDDALVKHNADKLATAHHKNDNAETFIFNMVRGSGLKGLSGIAPKRDRIIRPLLCLERQEIEAFLLERGIPFVTDESNLDETYSRNRIRHSVIPELYRIGDQAVEHIARLSDLIREADGFMERAAGSLYAECVSEENAGNGESSSPVYMIDINALNKGEHVLKAYVIRNVISKLAGGVKDISASNIGDVLLLTGRQSGRKVNLPYGIMALREGDRLILRFPKSHINMKEAVELRINSATRINKDLVIKCRVVDYSPDMGFVENRYTKWFDYDKIVSGLFLRTRRTGDRIAINDQLETQSIKKLFINKKIGITQREDIPLIVDGRESNDIIWAVGVRLSARVKISPDTKRIIQMSAEFKTGGEK